MEHIMRRAPRLSCEFDEFKRDIPENQLLKATASRLTQVASIHKGIAPRFAIASEILQRCLRCALVATAISPGADASKQCVLRFPDQGL